MLEQGPIRIMIVDNDRCVLDGFSIFFSVHGSIEVVAETTNVLDVVKKFLQVKPDIVLMDLLLSGLNSIDVMKKILKINPKCSFILYTNSRGAHLSEAAKAAGAAKLINKGISGESLLKTIQEVQFQ
jgi:NarL family two-component system response regulator LiaR